MGHVEEEALLHYTLGQLDAPAAAAVAAHLGECPECRERQQRLSSIAFARTAVQSQPEAPAPTEVPPPVGLPTRPDAPAATAKTPALLQRGATLGRYVLLEKLGAGGMGEVFAAYDPQLDRRVALKLLRTGALSADEGKLRLLREAQAMARLQHPNVIAVHDVGTFGERVFVAMEFVDGETLGEWLRGQRPWAEVLRIFALAGDGLAAAHRAGLVHRDFKPDNVLLGTDGRPRVLDFGLARQSTATPAGGHGAGPLPEGVADSTLAVQLTRDGAVMGTPGYMAPEQIAGLPTDARSDQFSFCVALWEGLVGQRPFGGATLRQHAAEIAAGRILPLPRDTEVPAWLFDVLRRGLRADPAERWPSMDTLLVALRPRARAPARRRAAVSSLVTAAVLALGFGLWSRQRAQVCGGQEQRLAGLWDDATRRRLRAGFVGSGFSFAPDAWRSVERTLDTWTADWAAAARDVCEAAKVRKLDTPEISELKAACLDERLLQLTAIVGLLGKPDREVVVNAPAAARSLEAATPCTTPLGFRRARALDEKAAAAERQLRAQLAEAGALFAAGKYGDAAARLKAGLTPDAPPAAQAEAQLLLARAELKRGQAPLEHEATLRAAEQALAAGEPALEARALSRLSASKGANEKAADTFGRLAHAAAARASGDWVVQVELAQNDGFLALAREHYAPALEAFTRVLTLQRERLGAEHPEVASTLNNLGVVLTHLKQPDRAIASYEESLRLHEALEGPGHPNVAAAAQNLAVALRTQGRAREAREAFARALAIRRQALGLAHPDSQRSASALVRLDTALGDLEPARALLDELRAGATSSDGPPAAEALQLHELETDLLLAGSYWREAEAAATRRLAAARAAREGGVAGAAGHEGEALLQQAQAWIGLGRWSDARQALAEAYRIEVSGTSLGRGDVAEAQGALELALKHPVEAATWLTAAMEQRQAGTLGHVRAMRLLGEALLEQGEAEAALGHFAEAERLLREVRAERLLPEARVQRARAAWLARPDERGAAAEVLLEVLPQLPEARRVEVTTWLQRHGGLPDAGR